MQQVPLLQTKLYIPPIRPELVSRPRLIERLNAGLPTRGGFSRALTLISAPAGFGKTTLVSEWVQAMGAIPAMSGAVPPMAIAWLSLDEGDNDPARFLAYMIAALRTIETRQESDCCFGKGVLSALRSSQPPPAEAVLTSLINEIAAGPDRIILVLDDYHVIESSLVDDAVGFLLEHLPPQMHLVLATRDDPNLPFARLRARGQLTDLRAADLRFTYSEAAEFLNQVMRLDLSAEDVAALEARTEGWIAGLQLAALALQGADSTQGHKDASSLIRSFTGSHRFVLDYLIAEVLEQQPESIQTFLLRTSVLDRLCGPLCDAVRFGSAETADRALQAATAGLDDVLRKSAGQHPSSSASGQETLEYLERANLFIVPLDEERRWYRYHHLFADLLRKRLPQQIAASPTGDKEGGVAELHIRASTWYEDNGLELEAFHHAAAANDVKRAARLIEGEGMPLTFRGAVVPVLHWLESLPATDLDAEPLLLVTYASAILATGQRAGVEEKLLAAEAALQGVEPDDRTRDLVGRIAATRATLAWGQNRADIILAQSERALEYLHPDNLPFRTSTTWKLGHAYHLQGDRAAASRAYAEAISICEASGNVFINIMASYGLGAIQEAENQLYPAAQTYRRALKLIGDQPILAACGAYLGLARVSYEWNDLDAAQQHGRQAMQLARQIDSNDAFASCGVFLARLNLAQGDVAGATAILAEADQFVRQHGFAHMTPEVAAAQVLVALYQGNLTAAADLAQTHKLPVSQARVHLAQGDAPAALAVLEPWRRQVEAKGWADERLKVMLLQAVALHAAASEMDGAQDKAVQLLGDALALAEPGGFVRVFVDEGPLMASLLYKAASRGVAPDYARRLLAAFPVALPEQPIQPEPRAHQPEIVEPLSERELEVLQLIAEGLTNQEIALRLFLALNTVKSHTRSIYGKLGVNSRTQAVARARALGVLPIA